jgi:tRNA(Arg) A34 adenosine deaminase TadA
MSSEHMITLGSQYLENIHSKTGSITKWKSWLADYRFHGEYRDDAYIWLACILALEAGSVGNFGVGCLMTDEVGDVILTGRNEVFSPYFRSDRHAEMVVLNAFEDRYKETPTMNGYVLYTSLEPCPMCLARLIMSGIPTVLYAAPDSFGGMVQKMKEFPPAFLQFSQGHVFAQAQCSPELVQAASAIFEINRNQMRGKLQARQAER